MNRGKWVGGVFICPVTGLRCAGPHGNFTCEIFGCNSLVKSASNGEWIGVDLDGTLAEHHGWAQWDSIGTPIPAMVERVRRWVAEGRTVKIMTARVHNDDLHRVCRHTGQHFTAEMMRKAIQDWCATFVGHRLEVVCVKDVDMVELWDDRTVQVETNTGRVLGKSTRGLGD